MAERMSQAKESIAEGEILHRERIGNKIVLAKLYHALMYCLFALFDIRDIGSLTHSDVIERFEREYADQGIFDRNSLHIIRRAYVLTHECDCEHMPIPTDEEIKRTMGAAKRFVYEVDDYLSKEMKK